MSRTVVVASVDGLMQQRLAISLTGMSWKVRRASGGAEAIVKLDEQRPEAMLIDNWLPDLEAGELARQIATLYPQMDLLCFDGREIQGCTKSPRRNELLHALREAQVDPADGSAESQPPPVEAPQISAHVPEVELRQEDDVTQAALYLKMRLPEPSRRTGVTPGFAEVDDEMVGESAVMRELRRMIRLVAPRTATVLIEGETGTGKEVVAQSLHRLSTRSKRPLVTLNCAAIPELLFEAELFGHTRGAFTGATQPRIGRIESAHGGTLFLDEIGEMPLALQAKMLRVLECGELQRVGENETRRVDVRVVAATHQNLEKRTGDGTFRLDLYHRLAVFPVEVPPLRERTDDIAALCEHFLSRMGAGLPRKYMTGGALDKLLIHDWPGNVRELAHVLERAAILCGETADIQSEHIRLRRPVQR